MKWPPKREGALSHAPIPQSLTLAPRRYGHCEHESTRIQLLPSGSVHHAEEVCSNCDAHLRWVPKPQTVVRRRYNVYKLCRLAMADGLSSWELSFIRSVSKLRKLSPRQQAVVDKLCARYLVF
jgi:hypothetical protein